MADGHATHSTRSERRRAPGTSWPPRASPGSRSRTRTLASLRVGLLSEPGRGFFQDLPLLPQHPILTPQPHQLLTLFRGQPVRAPSLVQVRLPHPVPDRLRRRLEFTRQALWTPPAADEIYYPPAELRRIGWPCPSTLVLLGHRGLLAPKWSSVHETGSTPVLERPTPASGSHLQK